MKKEKVILKVPSTIEKVMTMNDGGIRLFVDTQELTDEDKGVVMSLHKKIGHFVFSEQSIQPEDLVDLPEVKLEEGEKSPSHRLRSALFVLWDQKKISEPFDTFYKKQVERFIAAVKEKLN